MASEFPHEIFIHGPGDLGQSVFHHEPHGGYVANVKYIRADIAEQREAELAEAAKALSTAVENIEGDLDALDLEDVYTKAWQLNNILSKHKAEGWESG